MIKTNRTAEIDALVALLAETLRQRSLLLTTAESCTGGMIAAACTSIGGSSEWFERGFVTYSNDSKTDLLGVDRGIIRTHGAVSEKVVRAMAAGALHRSAAQVSIAVTGIAGPDGGTPTKPVGTVWLGFGRKGWDNTHAVEAQLERFEGDRRQVREAAVVAALEGVIRRIRLAR